MLDLRLPINIHLSQVFAWIYQACQDLPVGQREPACKYIQKLIDTLGETPIPLQVPLAHILCQTCDLLRAMNKLEEVQIMELLVQILKQGESRIIVGNINLAAKSIAEMDTQYEQLRKVVSSS